MNFIYGQYSAGISACEILIQKVLANVSRATSCAIGGMLTVAMVPVGNTKEPSTTNKTITSSARSVMGSKEACAKSTRPKWIEFMVPEPGI